MPLVIAAGPWITALMPELATRLTPSRQVVAYLEPPEELKSLWEARRPSSMSIALMGSISLPPGAGLR